MSGFMISKEKHKSDYVRQHDEKSFCPYCHQSVDLLAHRDGMFFRKPWFYICWPCQKIFQVAKGEVFSDAPPSQD